MGRTYTVPRSAKGESRILYIFSVKSLATTLAMVGVGWLVSSAVGLIVPMTLVLRVIILGIFGGIGFFVGAGKIPDSPIMGKLQKAGGEEVLDILLRLLSFKNKKKIYVYGLTRDTSKKQESSSSKNSFTKLFERLK